MHDLGGITCASGAFACAPGVIADVCEPRGMTASDCSLLFSLRYSDGVFSERLVQDHLLSAFGTSHRRLMSTLSSTVRVGIDMLTIACHLHSCDSTAINLCRPTE